MNCMKEPGKDYCKIRIEKLALQNSSFRHSGLDPESSASKLACFAGNGGSSNEKLTLQPELL